ncbi:MAG: 4-vinyl reductase, partial [Candidatus Bathyarchaeia archaeon]
LHGWGLNAKVKKESENVYTIDIKECYLCKDTESKKPVCLILSGIIEGMLAITLKKRFLCEEIKCKSMGDKSCVFLLKRLP